MNILVGYDGDAPSKEALKLAMKHVAAFGGMVDVVTSIKQGTADEQEDMETALRDLEAIKALFAKENIACKTHLLIRGLSPGEDLVKFARENKIDEIIIGVRKRSRVGKLLMGSTAQFVILESNCPVLSVKSIE